MSDLSEQLWNTDVGSADYTDTDERYRAAVLAQYQLCVEMADRVSARRSTANTYFLSLNTALTTILVVASAGSLGDATAWLLVTGLLALMAQCGAWLFIVRSYRQLNSAKYAVIGALEERLPAFAYSRAEWVALGEGKDWRRYLQLSIVEQWVPIIFALTYVFGFVALLTR